MYEPALYDKEVYAALNGVVAKAKKSYGGKSKSADGADGAKQQVEEFEQKMNAAHVERYESWRTQKRAEGHVFDDDYEERLKAAEAQALAEAEAAAKEATAEAAEDLDDMAAEVERISQQHEVEQQKLNLCLQLEQARQSQQLQQRLKQKRERARMRAIVAEAKGGGGGGGGGGGAVDAGSKPEVGR